MGKLWLPDGVQSGGDNTPPDPKQMKEEVRLWSVLIQDLRARGLTPKRVRYMVDNFKEEKSDE